VFFVESEEELALCPNCESELEYHSRVTRYLTDNAGIKSIYSIRVLKCHNQACPKTYHRELPNIIIPYKRFCAEAIEEAIEDNDKGITVAADDSTIRRWRNWFSASATYIVMALMSVIAAINDNAETSLSAAQVQKPIATIKQIVGRKAKWLSEATRILVNSSRWVFYRSAFLSG